MKPQTRILLIAVLLAAWVIPVVRLARFCSGAWRVYQDEQSLFKDCRDTPLQDRSISKIQEAGYRDLD